MTAAQAVWPFVAGVIFTIWIWAFAEVRKARRAAQVARIGVGQHFDPAPHTTHHVDFNRSSVIVCGDGCVEATCSFEGCPHRCIIGRNLAESIVGEP